MLSSSSCSCCLRRQFLPTSRQVRFSSSLLEPELVSSPSEETTHITTSPLPPESSQPLGDPLPHDEHACSVSLPTWASVVGYEEGDPTVTEALKCGYPRFVYHPLTVQVMETVLALRGNESQDCLVVPTAAAAARCQAFLQQALENSKTPDNALLEDAVVSAGTLEERNSVSSKVEVVHIPLPQEGSSDSENAVYAVLFPAETAAGAQAKAYWQHTGEVVSSRRAAQALQALQVCSKGRRITCNGAGEPIVYHAANACQKASLNAAATTTASSSLDVSPSEQLRERIAKWAGLDDKENVFLVPSGMASIYTTLRSARRYQFEQGHQSGGSSIVYGFPYLDTLKLCSRSECSPAGVDFFGHGNAKDLQELEQMLRSNVRPSYSALFTEVPSNPLLHCPDLKKLRQLADEYNFLLIVDDTISNFLNVELFQSGLADAVCSSLTKLVSGRGDAMAGSVVCNPYTPGGRWMQQDLQQNMDRSLSGGLYEADALAVLRNSEDFVERNDRINATSEALADWLHDEVPDTQAVYYPKYSPEGKAHYEAVKSPGGGYGGLMSIVLDQHQCQRTFYDALDVAKGPSLGTNFTLVCPYTLLAHYHELDFAMQYGVPPNLLRIAVGLEPLEVLQSKFESALRTSKLYPKLPVSPSLDATSRRSFSTLTVSQGPMRRSAQLKTTLRRVLTMLR